MNVFKRLYKKIFGEKQQNEKEQKIWYNNAHEKGESTHREGASPSGGGNGYYISTAHAGEKPM